MGKPCSLFPQRGHFFNGIEGLSQFSLLLSHHHIIHITPHPVFAWLKRLDDRVSSRMEMFRRVFVFGIITAAHMPTGHAQAQVNPLIAHRQAFLAPFRIGLYLVDLLDMQTFLLFTLWPGQYSFYRVPEHTLLLFYKLAR
jgi:hypothetical protein